MNRALWHASLPLRLAALVVLLTGGLVYVLARAAWRIYELAVGAILSLYCGRRPHGQS